MKAQLLSMDFLVALSVITASLGLFIQASDRLQSRSFEQALYANNDAEAIAADLVGEGTLATLPKYCAEYSNGSKIGDCLNECPRNTFTHSRLVECPTKACLLTVKICG